MRIFNWVPRHFIPKDGLSSHQNLRQDDEERGMLNIEGDTKALLDHNDPNYGNGYLQIHGWNKNIDGAAAAILSIGTFGLLKDEISSTFVQQYGFLDNKVEEDDDDDDGGEDHEWQSCGDRKMMNAEEDEKEKGEDIEGDWKPLLCDKNSTTTTTNNDKITGGSNDNNHGEEDIENKKKGRTTLADLFTAESHNDDVEDDPQHHEGYSYGIKLVKNEDEANYSNKKKLPAKAQKDGLLLFAKKKKLSSIPDAKVQDSRPIQKLHGLMKRMLKRKIHPDTNNADPKIKPAHCCSQPDYPPLTA